MPAIVVLSPRNCEHYIFFAADLVKALRHCIVLNGKQVMAAIFFSVPE